MEKKNILFISPSFFGYEIAIKNALIENGFDVDFFDERSSNSSFFRAIFRTKKKVVNFYILNYYKSIYKKICSKGYNYLFLIKGETIPEFFIYRFKKINPKAKLIFYTYDSINNNKNSILIMKHFDVCYSFDFDDVKKYSFLKLKHLFYTKEFINEINQKKVYEISFIGTLHSNRFNLVNLFFSMFRSKFLFYYMPAKWFFYYEKFTKKELSHMNISNISFEKLSKQQVANIFKISKSVLDIQRFGQSGLTMRTFEVLAAGAILITTNPYVKHTEFYNQENIIVIDDLNDINKIKDIVQYIHLPQESILLKDYKFDKYYINNWVAEFFE